DEARHRQRAVDAQIGGDRPPDQERPERGGRDQGAEDEPLVRAGREAERHEADDDDGCGAELDQELHSRSAPASTWAGVRIVIGPAPVTTPRASSVVGPSRTTTTLAATPWSCRRRTNRSRPWSQSRKSTTAVLIWKSCSWIAGPSFSNGSFL